MNHIVPLSASPPAAIETLLDEAFGADRHTRTAYKIRAGTTWLSRLSFAAVDDAGALRGTLQSWPVAVYGANGTEHPITLVGPVAVAPIDQGVGIGKQLMDALMAAAGGENLVMIGDPDYYGRFYGFSAAMTGDWSVPGPVERHRLLAQGLSLGSLPRVGRLGPITR